MRVPIVQAIEADDFSRCGGDVYARGHVRTLAREVGLEPQELVAQYDEEHGGRPQPTPPAALFEAERIRPERRRPNWTAAMVAAIVAVVGFVGFTLVGGGADQEPSKAKETPSAKPTETDTPSRPPETSPPEDQKPSESPEPSDSAIAAAPADKVTVQMTAEQDVWISARDHNGRLVHEGVLKKSKSKVFTDDKRLSLVLGNAGGVKLYVNGKEVEDVGEEGQVQRVSYTRGDPEAG